MTAKLSCSQSFCIVRESRKVVPGILRMMMLRLTLDSWENHVQFTFQHVALLETNYLKTMTHERWIW